MVIMCIFTGKGFTQQMYEQIRKDIDWEHNHPKGEIFHAVVLTNLETFMLLICGNQKRILITFLTVN